MGVPPAFQQQRREREQGIEALLSLLASARDHALEIAQYRRTMFLAYVEAGFTEAQALDLVKVLSL